MIQFQKVRPVCLSDESKTLLDTPNAGGSSNVSEAVSYEILRTSLNIHLRSTEMQIEYLYFNSPKIDYTIVEQNQIIGVSVTRAMNSVKKLSFDDVKKLVHKKLNGLRSAKECALDPWDRQILHIFVRNGRDRKLLRLALKDTPNDDTKIFVSIVTNKYKWIMENKFP
jgi:hypothetical protein